MLSPDYDDEDDVEPRWKRWLVWLRGRCLDGVVTRPEAIDPLAVARAVERLERGRWSWAERQKRGYFADTKQRGIRRAGYADTRQCFAWLVGARSAAADGGKAELELDRGCFWRWAVRGVAS